MTRNFPDGDGHVVKVLDADDRCPLLPLVDGQGYARAVIWPGVGAEQRSMHLFSLEGGSKTVEMSHASEATYYVIDGAAISIDRSDGSEQHAEAGSMIFVEPLTPYVISASDSGVRFVGGPCPPDPRLYEGLADA